MKSLIFNPCYHLRQDGNRVILFSDDEVSDGSEEWFSFIHPFHAMMFSFFDGQTTYKQEIEACANYFNLSYEKMEKIICRYVDNESWFGILTKNNATINFPKNILQKIDLQEKRREDCYHPSDFHYVGPPDYNTVRLKYPISINMELTMRCYANCIYCYAKRDLRDKNTLSLEEIKNFIRQAKKGGVYNIDINGGDVLLHPHIKEILHELVKNGYKPLISTKTTLNKGIIDYIANLKNVRLQISLDSVNPDILTKLIGVHKEYINEMTASLVYLSEIGYNIKVNVVLTKYNSDCSEIKNLLDYMAKFKTVTEVRFNPCGCSLYKSNFTDLALPSKQINSVLDYVKSLKKDYPFQIKFSSFDNKEDFLESNRKESFANRALCTGGTHFAVLLPNGDITICEELYDHPAFILGNIREKSLLDIWNSTKALKLYKEPLREDSDSNCKKCSILSECRTGVGVCWKMVLMAYGMEQWDYPDPRCPNAPQPSRIFYYD